MTDQPTKRGGARSGAGRKASDGATGLVPYTVQLPPSLKEWARAVGPARVRELLTAAYEESKE